MLAISDDNGILYRPTPAEFRDLPKLVSTTSDTHLNYCGRGGILGVLLTPKRDNFDLLKHCFDEKKTPLREKFVQKPRVFSFKACKMTPVSRDQFISRFVKPSLNKTGYSLTTLINLSESQCCASITKL